MIALLTRAAAGLPAAPAAAQDAAVYRRPLSGEPATLDPARIADVYGRSIAQQVFDGLVQFDQTLTIGPGLARRWQASRDGLTWTFDLQPGIRFHHGREVAADDVVFSLTRLLDPQVRSAAAELFAGIRGAAEYREGRAAAVSGLVALDRHRVQVTLDQASAPFVAALAVGHAKIVPRDEVQRLGPAFGEQPVGTGPFRFVRWERGREVVLAANPDYFAGAPRLGGLVFRIFGGGQQDAMYEEFRRGRLEDTLIPPKAYRQAIADPGAVYVKRPMFSVRFYGINTRQRPWSDRRVRRALAHAIDREALINEAFLGRHVPAWGILPPGTLSFNPGLRGLRPDPARARALLAEAGFPGGRGLPPLTIWSSVRHEGIVREHGMVERALEAVGLKVDFHYLTDWPVYSRMVVEGKAPMFLWAWFADVPDPDNFLFQLFHSRSPRNFAGYANPAVDALLVAARREADVRRRVDLYRRAEQLVVDDAPILPIWHYTYERLFQPHVRGVEVSGLGDPYIPFRKVWLEERR